MDEKPKLTVFSNHYVGGVANYHRNILSNDDNNWFDKKVVFLHWEGLDHSRMEGGFNVCREVMHEIGRDESPLEIATRLSKHIEEGEGVVFTNYDPELVALHFFPKKGRKVVYVCHDEIYVGRVKRYAFMIDAFIAHNPYFYELMREQLPHRKQDIHYLPFGVPVPAYRKQANLAQPLRLVWLARMHSTKGIGEIPAIDDLLKQRGVVVQWTMIGDGPDGDAFRQAVKDRNNFAHYAPADNNEVMRLLEGQDVFVLPSTLDGLPVSMLETMARGVVPVLYEFNTGIRKVITKNEGFVVNHGDREAFANCIVELNNDRDLLQRLSENAREKVVNDYDIKKQARKYFEFFRNLQPSSLKGAWKPVWQLHGKQYHPLVPAFMARIIGKLIRKTKAA